MNFRKTVSILAIAAACLVGTADAQAADLVFSGVSTTSDDYQLGVIWSGILAKQGSPLKLTVVDNGSVAGFRKMAQKRVDIVGLGAPHYGDAIGKTAAFKNDPDDMTAAYREMRVLFAIPTGFAQYVTKADSSIRRIVDFRGKKIGIGRPGGNAGRVSVHLFGLYGLNENDFSGHYLTYTQALEEMANGNMDATLVWGGVPDPAIDNASRTMKLRFISPSPDNLADFRKSITNGQYYTFKKIPEEVTKRAYEDRVVSDGPAYFWTFPFQIMVRSDMADDTAYELTKALWSHIDEVHKQSAALSLVTLDSAVDSLSGELHLGADRYFREIGVIK